MKKHHYIILNILLFCLCNHSLLAQGFSDVSLDAGINFVFGDSLRMGGGAAFFDYDKDGWEDIYIAGGKYSDRIYHNNGDGTFSDVSASAGLEATNDFFTHGVTTGDIDNDGYREVFLTTWWANDGVFAPTPNRIYKNNGDGTFSDISTSAGITDAAWSTSATFGDFNLDGFLDIYVTNYVDQISVLLDSSNQVYGFDHDCYSDFVYMNNGDATFTNRASDFDIMTKSCGLAVAATDYNGDANIDVMVANDFGEFIVPNQLFQNPDFNDVSAASGADIGLYGMGIAIGDYDEDDDLDYYITNLGRNALLQNQGDGTFLDVATSAGVENTTYDSLLTTGWGTAFFDYDNDTYLDLFVCNGQIPSADFIKTSLPDPHKLYRNNQDGTFEDVSVLTGIDDVSLGRGSIIGDYDKDGDVDMLTVILDSLVEAMPKIVLYRNDLNDNSNWVEVALQGVVSNRDAYGAHVRLYAEGRSFLREVGGGSSHASQNSSTLHFGLGNITEVDSILVTWPGGGLQRLCNISLNTLTTILEDTSAVAALPCAEMPSSMSDWHFDDIEFFVQPNPFKVETTINYHLPKATHLKLSILNTLGQQLFTLVDQYQAAGQHRIPFEAKHLPPGIYFYNLEVGGNVFSRRMVILEQ